MARLSPKEMAPVGRRRRRRRRCRRRRPTAPCAWYMAGGGALGPQAAGIFSTTASTVSYEIQTQTNSSSRRL